jgi:hypothetical protein
MEKQVLTNGILEMIKIQEFLPIPSKNAEPGSLKRHFSA